MYLQRTLGKLLSVLLSHTGLLLVILVASFLVRLVNLDYPIINGEAQRDYLVGRHIMHYGEVPLTGPCCLFNSTFGLIRNAPTYYYLVAAIVAIKDSILFVGFVNILLQLATIFLVYLIAKKLFSPGTALIAALFFSFSYHIVEQSRFLWQPQAMQPFVYASYLFLLLAYTKRVYGLLISSIILFVFAASFHNSVYALVPSYAILVFLTLKQQQQTLWRYVAAFAVAFAMFGLLYSPWFVHVYTNQNGLTSLMGSNNQLFVDSLPDLFRRFLATMRTLISMFLPLQTAVAALPNLLAFILLASLLWYVRAYTVVLRMLGKTQDINVVSASDSLQQRRYLLLLFGIIIQFLIVASLFNATIWFFYLTPIFGLFIIVVAEVLHATFSGTALSSTVKYVLIALILYVSSFSFDGITLQKPLKNAKSVTAATNAMKKEVLALAETVNAPTLNFFTVKVHAKETESPMNTDLVLWVPLEKALDTKLLRVVDRDYSYELINNDSYLLLVCQGYGNSSEREEKCITSFLLTNQMHRLVKNVYEDKLFLVYLTKKAE